MPYSSNCRVVLSAPACYCTGINSTPQHVGQEWHVFLCATHDVHGSERFYQSHALAVEFSTGKSRHGMLHVALQVVQTLSDLRTSTLICCVVNES